MTNIKQIYFPPNDLSEYNLKKNLLVHRGQKHLLFLIKQRQESILGLVIFISLQKHVSYISRSHWFWRGTWRTTLKERKIRKLTVFISIIDKIVKATNKYLCM